MSMPTVSETVVEVLNEDSLRHPDGEKWIRQKLQSLWEEQPRLSVFVVDVLTSCFNSDQDRSRALNVVAVVYALLRARSEADELNKQFSTEPS